MTRALRHNVADLAAGRDTEMVRYRGGSRGLPGPGGGAGAGLGKSLVNQRSLPEDFSDSYLRETYASKFTSYLRNTIAATLGLSRTIHSLHQMCTSLIVLMYCPVSHD